jgi:hypothetical protein
MLCLLAVLGCTKRSWSVRLIPAIITKDVVLAQFLGIGLLGLAALRRKFKNYLNKFEKRRENEYINK